MDKELRDLLTRYAKQEQDNPEPTEQDIEESREQGIEVFGTENKLRESLRTYFNMNDKEG